MDQELKNQFNSRMVEIQNQQITLDQTILKMQNEIAKLNRITKFAKIPVIAIPILGIGLMGYHWSDIYYSHVLRNKKH